MDRQAYIAAYFEGILSAEERINFENLCMGDPVFAQEVADYVMIRDALREQLYQQKREQFAVLHTELMEEGAMSQAHTNEKQYFLFRSSFWYGAVAACIGLIVIWFTLFRDNQPKDLATRYANTHFRQLSVTMSGEEQRIMQKGIIAFNKKNYSEASRIFQLLSKDSVLRAEAVKNLGVTQFMAGNYSNSIGSFDALAKMDLHTNPGLFYKATALMARSGPGDIEEARRCLKAVIIGNLPGKKQAEIWLEKL